MPRKYIHTFVKPGSSANPGATPGFRKTNTLDISILDQDLSEGIAVLSAHYSHICSHLDLNVKRGPVKFLDRSSILGLGGGHFLPEEDSSPISNNITQIEIEETSISFSH